MANVHRGEGPAPPAPPSPAAADCWVFDVDGCLIDSLTGTSLRPGARAVLEHLARVAGASSSGAPEATRTPGPGPSSSVWIASSVATSPSRIATAGAPSGPVISPSTGSRAVFVDDRPEDLGHDLDVLAVSPYLSDDPHDRGLEPVARRAGLH